MAISHSGSTQDTIYSLQLARRAGAVIICVTSYAKSPITQLSLIDILVTGVATRLYDQTVAAVQKTGEAVTGKKI